MHETDPTLPVFTETVTVPDDEIDVVRAALLVAAAVYPELNVESDCAAVDEMARVAARDLPAQPDPLRVANTLSEYLFDHLGFQGNRQDYYDPRNSFLNEVLSRRLGIPITLSLLYVEVGKRLGEPFVGLGMPWHFMVRHMELPGVFIDPFNGGVMLSRDECAQRLADMSDGAVNWDERFLTPVSNREFIARMLRNLKAVYLARKDYAHTLDMLDRLLIVRRNSAHDMRDRGLIHFRLGNFTEAMDDLTGYLASGLAGSDAPEVQRVIMDLRKQMD